MAMEQRNGIPLGWAMNFRRAFLGLVLTGLLMMIGAGPVPGYAQERGEQLQQEEAEDYYRKWLQEDVTYIITDEEKSVFQKLTTDEERERFIEQFWRRRDSDLKTSRNEFKEEHYRRIAYANERFASGKPGWKTDRGRIYIIHGPPDEIEESLGGTYERPLYEGGGTTSTFPFQRWRYRHLEGIDSDVELEFVDDTLSGAYRLALDPFEKDAFSHVPGIGLTLAEERGLATKQDRWYKETAGQYYPLMAHRAKDAPFQRLERYAGVMRPKQLKFNDLKSIVDVEVSFSSLPFRFHQDHFRLNQHNVIVPLTIELANRNLTFKNENGVQVAKLAIYGAVTGLGKQLLKEFEDEVITSFRPEHFESGLLGKSIYQKIVILEKGKRVKLDLVVKDLNSNKVGVITRAIIPPKYGDLDLATSSLVLSDSMLTLDTIPSQDEMFVLGDVKIRPNLDHLFPSDRLMGAYLQVYNAGIDQETLRPSLLVKYKLFRGNQELLEIVDQEGESIQFFSGNRIVLTRTFSPHLLGTGKYRIQVEIQDRLTSQLAFVGDEFEIIPPQKTQPGGR